MSELHSAALGDMRLYYHEHMAAVIYFELICHPGAVKYSIEHQMCIKPQEKIICIKCNVYSC